MDYCRKGQDEKLKSLRCFRTLFLVLLTICITAIITIKLNEKHLTLNTPEIHLAITLVNVTKGSNYSDQKFLGNQDSYTVLFWTPWFGKYSNWYNDLIKTNCNLLKKCTATIDKDDLKKSDAVVFSFNDMSLHTLPKYRHSHQMWIIFNMEPAPDILDLTGYNGLFNWTSSFRTDSDIPVTYGHICAHNKSFRHNIKPPWLLNSQTAQLTNTYSLTQITSLISGKSDMIAWFVSHCLSLNRREEYVEELSKFVKVHVYGKCGEYKCRRDDGNDCDKMLERDYKFYLSFENSNCMDYVTEKFFKILHLNVVPIVMGGSNYSRVAPPHSYIDVKDYRNPEELSRYLLYLDKNITAYSEYFAWKKHFTVDKGWNLFCSVCYALENKKEPKVYHDIYSWWKNDTCDYY